MRAHTKLAAAALSSALVGPAAAQRVVHLKHHLTTADLLTPAQRQRHAELRGYR